MIRKSTWIKLIKQMINQGIKKSLCEEKRKNIKYKGNTAKDIIKIELSMRDLIKNYIKEKEELLCSSCDKEYDTIKYILQSVKNTKRSIIKNNAERRM